MYTKKIPTVENTCIDHGKNAVFILDHNYLGMDFDQWPYEINIKGIHSNFKLQRIQPFNDARLYISESGLTLEVVQV